MSLFDELHRRNVIRVIVAYLAAAWLVIQVADTVFPALDLPQSALTILIIVVGIGFVPVTVISWAFDLTPDGLKRDADIAEGPQTRRQLDRVIIVVLARVKRLTEVRLALAERLRGVRFGSCPERKLYPA